MPRSTPDTPGDEPDEFQLPSVEAILAGALVLMTEHAQTGCPCERQVMRAKIASNIDVLARHAQLSPAFRSTIGQLCAQWRGIPDK